MSSVGDYIRQKRKLLYPGLKELANQAGISVSQLSKIERGESNPTVETLDKISTALNEEKHYLHLLAGYANEETLKTYLITNYDNEVEGFLFTEGDVTAADLVEDISRLSQQKGNKPLRVIGENGKYPEILGTHLFKETIRDFLLKAEDGLDYQDMELLVEEVADFYSVRRKSLFKQKLRDNDGGNNSK